MDVRVAGLLDDFGGTSAYMDLAALNRLLREGNNFRRVHRDRPGARVRIVCRAQEHSTHRRCDFKASGAGKFSEDHRGEFSADAIVQRSVWLHDRNRCCVQSAHESRSPSEAASLLPCASSVSRVARFR